MENQYKTEEKALSVDNGFRIIGDQAVDVILRAYWGAEERRLASFDISTFGSNKLKRINLGLHDVHEFESLDGRMEILDDSENNWGCVSVSCELPENYSLKFRYYPINPNKIKSNQRTYQSRSRVSNYGHRRKPFSY